MEEKWQALRMEQARTMERESRETDFEFGYQGEEIKGNLQVLLSWKWN